MLINQVRDAVYGIARLICSEIARLNSAKDVGQREMTHEAPHVP